MANNTLLIPLPWTQGEEMVKMLEEAGFEFCAAFWQYQPEADEWHFIIATPLVEKWGKRKTYERILTILSSKQFDMNQRNITIIRPDKEPVPSLSKRIHVESGHPPITWRGGIIEGEFFEQAHIYRMHCRGEK